MALFLAISSTIGVIQVSYAVATQITQQKDLSKELEETIEHVSAVLESIMDQLENRGHQLTVSDENPLPQYIASIKSTATKIERVLEKVQRKRGCIQTLFMKRKKYQRRLDRYIEQLARIYQLTQGIMPRPAAIPVPPQDIPDFRGPFGDLPEKEVSIFDFAIDKSTTNTTLAAAIEQFDPKKHSCYMKLQKTLDKAQFFISYQLRTWSTLIPIPVILEKRREAFTKNWPKMKTPNPIAKDSNQNSLTSIHTVPPTTDVASSINRKELAFSEFLLSLDTICGMALTRSSIYIATEHQITVYSLNNREVLATFGTEGDSPKSFKHISDIYIPPNDETNLYVVDRGQSVVHWYRIIDSDPYLEYVRQYVVIGNHNQPYRLQLCAVYKSNLYVTDSGNHCIHVFPLNGQRQSRYISDDSMTPFSPGPICAHGGYLYVADCSLENPSVIVLNEECDPVDWFRSSSIQQILAIDIEPNINELFILTTTMTEDGSNELKKQPLIVSMDLIIRTQE